MLNKAFVHCQGWACIAFNGSDHNYFEQSPDTVRLNQQLSFPQTQGTQICS